ncbi:hypothetical protein ZHAS_00019928 [Anopheles sinensis]|uniref:Uncharacterized protein n=1 Tax=Anopheles sinensis TaxID=74873 RepID=A0A084WMK3_ANOSI|nr:hypothetical protein ZHAS_00019928 [Anopheles sinensis]
MAIKIRNLKCRKADSTNPTTALVGTFHWNAYRLRHGFRKRVNVSPGCAPDSTCQLSVYPLRSAAPSLAAIIREVEMNRG